MNEPDLDPVIMLHFTQKIFRFSSSFLEFMMNTIPADTWQLINLRGEKHILDYIYDLTYYLSRAPKRPTFQKLVPKKGRWVLLKSLK